MAERINDQPSFYAVIPANVRYDKRLTPNAKLLYGEITALCNEKGFCWASNNYFADLYEVTPQAISKWINSLSDNGFIKLEKNESIVIELKNKKLDGLGYGRNICEWCGIRTAVLHKHHYPIQKSNGGNAVVNICPNCHHEFHYSEIKISLNISCDELKMLNTEKGKYHD